jgi:hypothetical protein
MDREEDLISNLFAFTSVPKTLRHFQFPGEVSREQAWALHEGWAFRNLGGKGAIAFSEPPASFTTLLSLDEVRRIEWSEGERVEGILAEHLVSELLDKSLQVHCRARGLVRDPGGRGFYFPFGLLPKNTLLFEGYKGKPTRVLACGYRALGGRRYSYHLGPWFRVRHDPGSGFTVQLRLRLHLADYRGTALEKRAAGARRKKIGAAWWNGHWLNRQLAVMSFLTEGEAEIRIGKDLEHQVVLVGCPAHALVGRGIDEALLATIGAPPGLLIPFADEKGEEGE